MEVIYSALATAIVTLTAGAVVWLLFLPPRSRRLQALPKAKPSSERLAELSASVAKASREFDSVLAELAQVARIRQTAVEDLEANLASLESREKELKEREEALEKTPLPVAEHFARFLEAGERRSAKRDYFLFGAGVIVTTVIAALFQIFAS